MAEDSKIRSLTNEVIRRLTTTSERISDDTRCLILDRFAQKMTNSGYGLTQIRRVVLGGIKGYEKMMKISRSGGRKLHRSSGESSATRALKKLTGKSEWFRKGDSNEDTGSIRMGKETDERLDKWRKAGKTTETDKKTNGMESKLETRSVFFVEQSKGGELAKRLREIERKANRIVGYKTKIVEGVGSKLKDLLPNNNPWKGAHCGRPACIPCSQPGEMKQDCRKRSIIYENTCQICNPEDGKEKVRKDGRDLADGGKYPSVYVGESGRSLHERAREHWADFDGRQTDSHILKHWMVHHKGQGTPDFRIRVIKYCKDALSRQVGEAVRISYRGQTLNSKSGYNRSGISRLVLEEEKEEEQIRDDAQEDEETPEPRGLTGLTGGWKTGEKRSQERQDVHQQPRRKRRKLKFDILDDDWGCMATGEDLDRIEEKETARSSFLMAGDTNNKSGKVGKQTTIRNWSISELAARSIILEIACQSERTGRFMSSLLEGLQAAIKVRLEAKHQNICTLAKDDISTGGLEVVAVDELEEVRRARATSSTIHQTSKEEKEPPSGPEGRKNIPEKMNTINSMFAKQNLVADNQHQANLLREERLESKRRMELKWKDKKRHNQLRTWARDWLVEMIVEPAEDLGRVIVTNRMDEILEDLTMSAIKRSDQNTSARLEKQARLDRAREQREVLTVYLDRWWTSLEGGVPEMETSLEPHYTQKGLKRHRDLSKTDRARRTELEDAMEMATEVVKDIMAEVGVRHDCGMSTACPAWYCCSQVKKADLERRINNLSKLIDDLTLKDPELEYIRDIIEHIPPTKKEITRKVLELGKLSEGGVEPDLGTGRRENVKPIKPPSKRKIWTRLKSGLFGWKVKSYFHKE
jgi:hypothetical protein